MVLNPATSEPPSPDTTGTVPKCFALGCPETAHLRRVRFPILVGSGGYVERYYCPTHFKPDDFRHMGAQISDGEFGEPDPYGPPPGPVTTLEEQLAEHASYVQMIAEGRYPREVVSMTVEMVDRKGKRIPRITVVLEGRP
jgi:hypothetical protein